MAPRLNLNEAARTAVRDAPNRGTTPLALKNRSDNHSLADGRRHQHWTNSRRPRWLSPENHPVVNGQTRANPLVKPVNDCASPHPKGCALTKKSRVGRPREHAYHEGCPRLMIKQCSPIKIERLQRRRLSGASAPVHERSALLSLEKIASDTSGVRCAEILQQKRHTHKSNATRRSLTP